MTSAARHILELVRALCVLGLVFLNFAHTPAAAASGTTVFCGERPAGDGGTALVRDPCPACRLADDGLALPPPGRAPLVLLVSQPVAYDAATDAVTLAPLRLLPRSRGPPAA